MVPMLRYRVITLLSFMSLVITMVTITNYSNYVVSDGQLLQHAIYLNSNGRFGIGPNNSIERTNSKSEDRSEDMANNIDKIHLISKIMKMNSNRITPKQSPPSPLWRSNRSIGSVGSDHDFDIQHNDSDNQMNQIHSSILSVESKLNQTKVQFNKTSLNSNENKTATTVTSLKKTITENNSSMSKSLVNKSNSSEITDKPKPTFNAEDLKTTETMRIDKLDMCDDNYGANFDMLIIVGSAVFNFDARSAIRQTWGKLAIEKGSRLYFLIGDTLDSDLQSKVQQEDDQYHDLLQGAFIDNYYNLTLKTIAMMRIVSQRCNQIKYLFKFDDDMIVNMQKMIDYFEKKDLNNTIIGKLAPGWKPHRDKANKWYVPESAFAGKVFPNFVTGPAYAITGDALKPLYETSVKMKPIYLEDVYMTGIVARNAGVKRKHLSWMCNVAVVVNECTFPKLMTSHRHSPEDIVDKWNLLYDSNTKTGNSCANDTSEPVSCIARRESIFQVSQTAR